MTVELTVRCQVTGAMLTITDSTDHTKRTAITRATKLSVAWAKRYGMPQIQQSGPFWTIGDARGISQAQISIR